MYTDFWKKWRNYSGKTSRKTFWEITLINFIITILICGMQLIHETHRYVMGAHVHWIQPQTYSVFLIWLAFVTVPTVAMIARRYKDVGVPRTGLTIALTAEIVLIIGGLILAYFIFKDFGAIYSNIDVSQMEAGKAHQLISSMYKVLAAIIIAVTIYILIVLLSPSNVQVTLDAAKANNDKRLIQLKHMEK